MDIDEIRSRLEASGGDIAGAGFGAVSTLMSTFDIPSVIGPVSVEDDSVVVQGSVKGFPAKVTIGLEDDELTVLLELEVSGPARELMALCSSTFPLPLPDVFRSESLKLGATSAGKVVAGVDFTGTVSGVTLDASANVGLSGGQPEVDLSGSATCQVDGRDVTFILGGSLMPNGIVVFGSMDGTLQFGDFQLSNTSLVVGIDDELIPSIGIAASLNLQNLNASVAVFFDSTSPGQSMLAGSLCAMSLTDALVRLSAASIPEELSGALSQIRLEGVGAFQLPAEAAAALDARDLGALSRMFADHGRSLPSGAKDNLLVIASAGQSWFLTDLQRMRHYQLTAFPGGVWAALEPQLYIAPQDTSIGAQSYRQGIFLEGAISVFGFRAEDRLEVRRSQGLLVAAAMDPMVFLDPSFVSISSEDDPSRGPILSISTFHDENATDPNLAPPHCLISGRLHLLGLTASVLVNINSDGMTFHVENSMEGLVAYRLDCSIAGNASFSGAADMTMGGNQFDLGPLGTAHIPQVSANIQVSYQNGTASAGGAVVFSMGDLEFNSGQVEIGFHSDALADLPGFIGARVKDAAQLLMSPEKWAGMVRDGIIQDVNAVGNVLRDQFNQDAAQAAAVLNAAGYAAHQVSNVLEETYNVTGDAANQVLQAVGYPASVAAAAVGGAVISAAQTVGQGAVAAESMAEQGFTNLGKGVLGLGKMVKKHF